MATPLQNGDFVQILTCNTAHPSLDWLNFVATPTARNRIRQWYKRSHRDETIERGKDLLERELGRDGFDALLHGAAMARVAQRCNVGNTDDLLACLGFGSVTLHQVLNRLREEIRLLAEQDSRPLSNEEVASALVPSRDAAPQRPHHDDAILGVEGLDYRLGGCCSPLPGEPIIGTVALGNHGITVHRQDCSNVEAIPRERRLPVRWNDQRDAERQRFPVQLRIEVIDRVGILKDILMRLSDGAINVSDARVTTSAGRPARIDLRVELQGSTQLSRTMDQIRSMADVIDIARTGTS